MTQYFYVVDTDILDDNNVAVGQSTYNSLISERLSHGVIPLESTISNLWVRVNNQDVGIYTSKQVSIGTDSLLAQLTVQGNAYISSDLKVSGVTTSVTYVASGTSSGTDGSSSTITVDASTTQMYSHIASFSTGTTTFQVSNLSVGRQVFLYIRNTNALNSRTISITASTTTSGYSSINLSRSGAASVTSFSEGTSGTATVWVANINGNLVGSLS
jgi:hypothetical protein